MSISILIIIILLTSFFIIMIGRNDFKNWNSIRPVDKMFYLRFLIMLFIAIIFVIFKLLK